MSMKTEGQVRIEEESDIVAARQTVRGVALEVGFSATDTTRIVTAASELARNVLTYAGSGEMLWRVTNGTQGSGLELKFVDQGPGIADLESALQPGFSTGKGLGLGLPGAKRLMDDMEIDSTPGKGTTIKLVKWRRG